MIVAKIIEQLPGGIVGFIAGAFCPAIGRKIKALFVKETQSAEKSVATSVSSAASSVASEAKKI